MPVPADEAGHGVAVLASPVSESWAFWNWVNNNSRAACVSLANDSRTGKPTNRLLIEYRTAIEEMVPAINTTDLVLRASRVSAARAKAEKALLGQFIQAVLVRAQQAAQAQPATAGTCYSSCWKSANAVSYALNGRCCFPRLCAVGKSSFIMQSSCMFFPWEWQLADSCVFTCLHACFLVSAGWRCFCLEGPCTPASGVQWPQQCC
jgi:hypothetical protein